MSNVDIAIMQKRQAKAHSYLKPQIDINKSLKTWHRVFAFFAKSLNIYDLITVLKHSPLPAYLKCSPHIALRAEMSET